MNKQNAASSFVVIICLTAIGLGCAGMRKPWRSYEQKPFDAQKWRSGDAIERGTMTNDLAGVRTVLENVGENKDQVIATLGKPYSTREEKIGSRKTTVFLYEVDLGNPEFRDALQIFFDEADKTMYANLGVIEEKKSLFSFARWKK